MVANNNNKKHAALAILMGAIFFNLSSLPGLESLTGSTDSSSSRGSFLTCDFEGQVRANGISTCETEKDNVRGTVTIKEVASSKPLPAGHQGPPTPGPIQYEVTRSLTEAVYCDDGSCSVTKTVGSLREAIAISERIGEEQAADQKKKAAEAKKRDLEAKKLEDEEKAKQARIDKCEVDAEGKELNTSKALVCLARRMEELKGDPEKAADFYNENMRERLQALLKSDSLYDRQLGMAGLQALGKGMGINCQTRPGMQANGQNPLVSNQLLNPIMNGSVAVNTIGTRPGTERNFVTESACDLWAFGSYNHNIQHLQLAATQPGAEKYKPQFNQAINTLKAGWGQYFNQRGLALSSDALGLNGMTGFLANDYSENNASIDAGMKSIIERHKDLLEPVVKPMVNQTTGAPVDGRMARGGVAPQNALNVGQPAVNPWGTTPGSVPTQAPRPGMQPASNTGRYSGAPRMGTPVGGSQLAPQSTGPVRR